MAKSKTKKASSKKSSKSKSSSKASSKASKKKSASKKTSKKARSSKAKKSSSGSDKSDRGSQAGARGPSFTPHAHEKAGLKKAQVTELYEKLVEERARVLRGLDKHLGEAVNDIDPLADEVDVATRHSEQAYLIRFADKERKLLREIDHALDKLREGEYGLCEGTDEAIGYARLSLRPWTRYSVRYKEELEREKRQRQF